MVLLLSAVESRLASIALVLAVWALSALQLVVPHRVVVQSKPLVLSLVDVLQEWVDLSAPRVGILAPYV